MAVLAALFVVLLATGVWLSFRYQPSGHFAGAHHESWIRAAHRTASKVFVGVALGVFGLSLAVSIEAALKRGLPAWVLGLVLFVGALAASISGFLLPWDQLALAPVLSGEFRGYGFLFGHSKVHFVLIGSTEVGRATLRTWFAVHTVALPVLLIALGAVGLRITAQRRLRP